MKTIHTLLQLTSVNILESIKQTEYATDSEIYSKEEIQRLTEASIKVSEELTD